MRGQARTTAIAIRSNSHRNAQRSPRIHRNGASLRWWRAAAFSTFHIGPSDLRRCAHPPQRNPALSVMQCIARLALQCHRAAARQGRSQTTGPVCTRRTRLTSNPAENTRYGWSAST